MERGVVNERGFSKQVEQRMKDIESYTWRGEKQNVSKLKYNMYKTSFQSKNYLTINMPNKFVRAQSRLRLISHSLAVEVIRHHNIPYEARLCSLCGRLLHGICVECEFHFL